MEHVADEAVHKELGDSLVRAATTASSLEAEHDSGGGPRCSEAMGDTTAQTRVLELETTKTTQQNVIDSLKRRVKKLEKRNGSRTYKLKRLYKVGLTARVESSGDEYNLGEDASKQGKRIDVIDQDEDITLLNDQDDAEMFDVNDLGRKSCKREKAQKEQEANITLMEEWNDIQAKINADYQLAERLQAKEQEELTDAEKATLFVQLLEKRRTHFAAKRAEKKRNRPPMLKKER
nr:hypothetical protein [Tanacetum cinerariifolium]